MFKISIADTPSRRTLLVEGTLIGAWVDELGTTCRNASQDLGGRKLVVDLTNVTIITPEGEDALFDLMKKGVNFYSGSVLTKHVLKHLSRTKQQELRGRVKMPETKHITSLMPYASSDDFRRIFYEEDDSLHRLSFLLTADREKAEQCFVSGLQEAVNGSPVFKAWAHSWARRTIIQNAARVVKPRPVEEHASSSFDGGGTTLAVEQVETATVLQLEPFERFVYVMSVLERYSDLDCSLLLGCARQDVIAARIRAFQQIETQSTFALSAG